MAGVETMRLLRWTGLLLSMVALGFIAMRFMDHGTQLRSQDLSISALFVLALLTIGYAAANVPLATAWRKLLIHLGDTRDLAWAIRVYGQSQLAKYIPGNVFHLAGRQAIGMADGVSTGRMAKSAVWEIGTIAVAAATFAVFLVIPGEALGDALAFAIVAAVAGTALHRQASCSVAAAFVMYVIFFLVSGAIFVVVLKLLDPGLAVGMSTVVGAYVIAWLAGMVTPGAPAGLGVREVFLFGILQSYISQADLLVAVALSRLVTAAGDLIFYLAATFAPPRR